MRLAFMGSPDFAVPALKKLIAAGHEIACVYSQPPRPSGRGKKLTPTAVHSFAETQGLDVRYPETFKSEDEKNAFQALNLDVAIVVAYGLILPRAILDAPIRGCINLHGSLLPRWRGAAPMQRAIMAGDPVTGVQTMVMEKGLDTGPVYMTETTPITAEDTLASVHDRLAEIGADLLVKTLDVLAHYDLPPTAQSSEGVTYAKKITAEDKRIDWARPASEIDRQIRGLAPQAWFEIEENGKMVRVKALHSVCLPELSGPAGTILDDQMTIACGQGAIRLPKVHKAGKSPCSAEEFLRGTPLKPGDLVR